MPESTEPETTEAPSIATPGQFRDFHLSADYDGHCLRCGKVNDGAFNTDSDSEPAPGHIVMCLYCGFVCKFGETKFENLSEEEYGDVLTDVGVARALWARAIMAAKGEVPLHEDDLPS